MKGRNGRCEERVLFACRRSIIADSIGVAYGEMLPGIC